MGYFAVPLGLYNLLAHYQYESQGFLWNDTSIYNFENLDNLNKTEYIVTTENVDSGTEKIPITKYTGLSMKTYYVIFLFGMLFHFLLMLVKLTTESSEIHIQTTSKNSKVTETSSFLRAFTSFVIPEVSSDWDENETMDHSPRDYKDVIEKYKQQWQSVKMEYTLMVFLHAIENFLMVIPALYTYGNIVSRNAFLEETVGLVPMESLATQRWEWIVTMIPSLIIISVPMQLVLILAFNKYGHPWKRFFAEFSRLPKRSSKFSAVAATYVSG